MVNLVYHVSKAFPKATNARTLLFREPGRDLYVRDVAQIHSNSLGKSGAGIRGNDYALAHARLSRLPQVPTSEAQASEKLQIEEELRQLGQQIYKPLDVTLHYRNQGFYEWIDEIPHNHHKDGFNSVTFGTLNLEVQKRVFTPRSDLEILSGDEAIVTAMELHDQRNNGERKFFMNLFPKVVHFC